MFQESVDRVMDGLKGGQNDNNNVRALVSLMGGGA